MGVKKAALLVVLAIVPLSIPVFIAYSVLKKGLKK